MSETVDMTPLAPKPPKVKRELTKADALAMIVNCRKAEGRFNEWGPEAKARLTELAASFGITLNFNAS